MKGQAQRPLVGAVFDLGSSWVSDSQLTHLPQVQSPCRPVTWPQGRTALCEGSSWSLRLSGKCSLVKKRDATRERPNLFLLWVWRSHICRPFGNSPSCGQTHRCWAEQRGCWSTQVTNSEHQPWGHRGRIIPMSCQHTQWQNTFSLQRKNSCAGPGSRVR